MNDVTPLREYELSLTRRQLFGRTALGLGTAAMAQLLGPDLLAGGTDAATGLHHPAKAKRVIYLFMSGGPSHHDLWDYKPKMAAMFGKELPVHIRDGQRITGMTSGQKTLPVCPSKYPFKKYENNDRGVWVSELLPHTATVVKELCIVHSAFTEAINHDPAITYIQTGSQIPGRPSLGAWLSYGLGSMNENLPGYVVLTSGRGSSGGATLWQSGFLPSTYAGVLFRSQVISGVGPLVAGRAITNLQVDDIEFGSIDELVRDATCWKASTHARFQFHLSLVGHQGRRSLKNVSEFILLGVAVQ